MVLINFRGGVKMNFNSMKFLLLILVAVSVVVLFGCNDNLKSEKETTTVIQQNNQETDKTLPALPVENLEAQKQNKEETVYKKWYEGDSPTLIPRNDYGPLVPFIGMCKNYTRFAAEGGADDLSYYGVMTKDGRVVVDPIYPSIFYVDLDNGERLLYFNSFVDSDYKMKYGSALAASDGSWVIDMGHNGELREHKDNKLIISYYKTEDAPSRMEVYDYNGNLLFKVDGYMTDRAFNSGYLPVYNSIAEEDTVFRIIDENGNFVFDEYDYASEFKNGYLVVEKNDLYGVIDTKGKWFIDPIYKDINSFEGEYFEISLPNNKYMIIDENKKKVVTYTQSEEEKREYLFYAGKLIYKYEDIYRFAEDDEPIVCKANGMKAKAVFEDGLFYCSDESQHYIFDIDGNLVKTIDSKIRTIDFKEYKNYYEIWDYPEDGTAQLSMYDKRINKMVYTVCYKRGEDGSVYVYEEAGLILMSKIEGDYRFKERQIYDIRSEKVLFEDFVDCNVEIVDGDLFISVCDENYIEVYNGNLDAVLRYPNK